MKKKVLLLTVILVVGLAAVAVTSADPTQKTVATRGTEKLDPNRVVFSDLRFSPGKVTIQSGDSVQWVHDDSTDAPHTVTVASPDQLVQSFGDFLGGCPACDAAIGAAVTAHFTVPLTIDVNVGGPDFGDVGDSYLFFHGESFSKQINAPAGSTLYYFCAIHPWMQGTIDVN